MNSIKDIKEKNSNKINNKVIKNNIPKKYDDFELNRLEYIEAIKFDKRTLFQIYLATLKREHLLIFTFFNCNDYNLLSIKISRFIFLIVEDMALNVFFFSDDSMHKLFINYGKYDFFQQIPQITYSTIISQLIEIFLLVALLDFIAFLLLIFNEDLITFFLIFFELIFWIVS